jgi:hypothetical protein
MRGTDKINPCGKCSNDDVDLAKVRLQVEDVPFEQRVLGGAKPAVWDRCSVMGVVREQPCEQPGQVLGRPVGHDVDFAAESGDTLKDGGGVADHDKLDPRLV